MLDDIRRLLASYALIAVQAFTPRRDLITHRAIVDLTDAMRCEPV